VDSRARFDRIVGIQREVETTERRLMELTSERKADSDRINADDLKRSLGEFDNISSSLTTKEQEQLIQMLVSRIGYDGRTGRVTVNFRSAGAKELCQTRAS
jgi:site-specific DNA recombinase